MPDEPISADPAASTATMSAPARLVGALTSPGRTFRDIAARPTWGLALIVLVVVTAASSLLLMQSIDRDQFRQQMREQIEAQGQAPTEESLAMAEKFGIGCWAGAALGGSMVVYFLLAGLLMGFNLLGGRLDYRTSLSVTLHGMMPFALLSLLSIPVVIGRGSVTLEELQSGTLLPSNLAAFAPEDAGRRLLALLSSIDLFSLWTLVLFVLGYHLAAKVSKGLAAAVIVGLWVLLVGIKVGLVGLGGG
jgi:hypothetical protein